MLKMTMIGPINYVEKPSYETEAESNLTRQAIEDLAAHYGRPRAEVCEILKLHMFRLSKKARIKQFVMLLAIKEVKQTLTAKQSPEEKTSFTVDSMS